ncbi:hypothetical protein [Deinococcus aerius]|uniref:hypothetical protein n=1 Tax=Deinococcus aerius TaxID=200253 RepID=UPI001056E545|nr:hypothetical protein [Deinococcus aerius]
MQLSQGSGPLKLSLLAVLALVNIASAGGLEASSGSKIFQANAFCQKYGCLPVASWQRFGRKYEVYRLSRDSKVELSIYRDSSGGVVGATYSTWTVDDWSADYGRAAEFLSTVFAGADINRGLLSQVDKSRVQAGANVGWRGQTLVLFRELVRVPSFNQLLRVNVSAGLFKSGQP